jgi:hypothetical protein
VETALSGGAQSASCTDAAMGCDCTTVFDGSDTSSGTYTVDGGVATVDGDDEWYFCAEGDSLTLREKADDGEDHPVFLLSK